jgi:hypothetical protein
MRHQRAAGAAAGTGHHDIDRHAGCRTRRPGGIHAAAESLCCTRTVHGCMPGGSYFRFRRSAGPGCSGKAGPHVGPAPPRGRAACRRKTYGISPGGSGSRLYGYAALISGAGAAGRLRPPSGRRGNPGLCRFLRQVKDLTDEYYRQIALGVARDRPAWDVERPARKEPVSVLSSSWRLA